MITSNLTTALALLALPESALDALRDLLPDSVPGIGGSGLAVDEETLETYRTALRAVVDDDDQQAVEAFESIWDRREELGDEDDGLDIVLPAGIGMAALVRLQADRNTDVDPKRVLGLIEPHWKRLDLPVATVFEHVSDRYPDATEDDIPAVGRTEPDDLDDLEVAAFARLLERHLEDDVAPPELYRRSLQAMMHHRADIAVDMQSDVWDEWESDEEPSEEVLGAGVALAGHLDFIDEFDLDVTRDEIVSAVEPHEDRLSVAPAALFERLSTGSTDADPGDIVDEHVEPDPGKFDAETADLHTLETLGHSNLLQTLRDRED